MMQFGQNIKVVFIVNSVVTVGLFLKSYFKHKFPEIEIKSEITVDYLPF